MVIPCHEFMWLGRTYPLQNIDISGCHIPTSPYMATVTNSDAERQWKNDPYVCKMLGMKVLTIRTNKKHVQCRKISMKRITLRPFRPNDDCLHFGAKMHFITSPIYYIYTIFVLLFLYLNHWNSSDCVYGNGQAFYVNTVLNGGFFARRPFIEMMKRSFLIVNIIHSIINKHYNW